MKINIVDTPGHADFGGEVERVLKMVNGVLLLVDAAEGCMPQTRFVLQKALQQNLSLVIAVNKIDRPDARIEGSHRRDASAPDGPWRHGRAAGQPDGILLRPCRARQATAPMLQGQRSGAACLRRSSIMSRRPRATPPRLLQMLCSSVDYNDFVGRIGIGRVENGSIRVGQEVSRMRLA